MNKIRRLDDSSGEDEDIEKTMHESKPISSSKRCTDVMVQVSVTLLLESLPDTCFSFIFECSFLKMSLYYLGDR